MKKKHIIGIGIIIFLGAGLLIGAKLMLNRSDDSSDSVTTNSGINFDPPSESEVEEAEKNKIDKIENPTSSSVDRSVNIQEAYQDSATNQIVVKTELYGVDWESCKLTLSRNSVQIEKRAETLYQQPYSICMGFAIDINELGSSGTWNIRLEAVNQAGESFSANEKTVDVKL